MIGSIYTAASALNYDSQLVDTAANNLANEVTPGYQSQSLVATAAPSGNGVAAAGVQYNFSGGPLMQTGQATNLAISGPGYFQVETASGETAYTRNGDFVEDAQGYLRTPDGGYVLNGGSRVQIPAGLTFNLSTINLTNFANNQGLAPLGNGLFAASSASGTATTGAPGTGGRGTLISGALEISNVDPVTEMVSMIVGRDSFEANVKTIQVSDEMLKATYQMVDGKKRNT